MGAVVRLNKILHCPGLKQRQLCVAQAMFSQKQLINGVLAVALCRNPAPLLRSKGIQF